MRRRREQLLRTCLDVSIHAPGRGATISASKTSRRKQVSIHAPGRGATLTAVTVGACRVLVSIHAPGRGATATGGTRNTQITMFQFTHPGGVRLPCRRTLIFPRCFNSRTREGCDVGRIPLPLVPEVSIHAPGRGATRWLVLRSFPFLFQFTHPGGVRPGHIWRAIVRREFQFTHPGGVRQLSGYYRGLSLSVSIHAPGRGATLSFLA